MLLPGTLELRILICALAFCQVQLFMYLLDSDRYKDLRIWADSCAKSAAVRMPASNASFLWKAEALVRS